MVTVADQLTKIANMCFKFKIIRLTINKIDLKAYTRCTYVPNPNITIKPSALCRANYLRIFLFYFIFFYKL